MPFAPPACLPRVFRAAPTRQNPILTSTKQTVLLRRLRPRSPRFFRSSKFLASSDRAEWEPFIARGNRVSIESLH